MKNNNHLPTHTKKSNLAFYLWSYRVLYYTLKNQQKDAEVSGCIKESLRCSSNSSANMSDIIRKQLGQSKISNFWHEVHIKENVTSFDVSMYYVWLQFFVKK